MVKPYLSGGGIDEIWTPGMKLPKLSLHAQLELSMFVRHHQPVDALCACHTKAFSAQIILKQHVQDWYDLALVSCRVVSPVTGFHASIGELDCS